MTDTLTRAALTLALLAPLPLSAQMTPNTTTTAPDFLKTAAASDEFEGRSGRLAAERAASPQIKAFGEQMVAAHTQTTRDLGEAARAAGQRAPAPDLDPGQEKMLAMLGTVQGPDFDKLYLQQQHETHKDALGLMQTYAQVGREPPLRAAAAKTAPMVAQHLAIIAAMQVAMR